MCSSDLPSANDAGKSRRNFLKFGLVGAGAAAVVATGAVAVKRMQGIPHDEFPVELNDDFKPIDQRNQINVFCGSKALNEKHPERTRSFNEMLKKEDPANYKPFDFYATRRAFMSGPYRDAPGYGQLDRALAVGGFSSARQQLGGGSMEAPNSGVSRDRKSVV